MDLSLKIKKEEYWWGGAVADGYRMPLSAESDYYLDARVNKTYNQFNGVFLSSAGRYIVFEGGAEICVKNGYIKIINSKSRIFSGDTGGSLKSAQKFVSAEFFKKTDKFFDFEYLTEPQYCTWLETLTNVNAVDLEKYAAGIRKCGLDGKVLIIDDGWAKDYGDWTFDEKKFPAPRETVKKLKDMGFDVVLWLVPFVNAGCPDYGYLRDSDAFVKNPDGTIHIAEWWNGSSAVLDMSSSAAVKWIKNVLDRLVEEYGVSGFKLDAGDAMYYPQGGNVSANEQSALWAKLGAEYSYAELRACVGLGGYPVAQRLSDKSVGWENGMKLLIPNIIQAGLLGYYYCCGDMVGGGNCADFEKLKSEEAEFYIRSCQCAALFPIVQFSYSIWNKSEFLKETVKNICFLRAEFKDYMKTAAGKAITDGEPVVRCLEYEFPEEGFWNETQCFMLGDRYLVAPVVNKGEVRKTVKLPRGIKWRYVYDGKLYENRAEIDCPVSVLPIFERL